MGEVQGTPLHTWKEFIGMLEMELDPNNTDFNYW